MWVSQKNGNRRRQESDQPPSPQRTQAPKRIRLSFPKSARILKRGHFKALIRDRSRFVGETIVIDYRIGHSNTPKLGLTVTKKYGNAVQRNRFKRLVREVFRQNHHLLLQELEMNIFPKKGAEVSIESITSDLLTLNKRIQASAYAQSPAETSR